MVKRRRLPDRQRPLAVGSLALAGLAGLAAYALWYEPAMCLRLVRWRVALPGWHGRRPFRLVIISDLHAGAPHIGLRRVRRIVRRANALQPDLAILLGDYAAAHPFTWSGTGKRDIIERLRDFTSPNGLYAVLGNHDWWQDADAQARRAGPTQAHRELARVGIPCLENRAVRIGQGDEAFWLAGLGDQRPFQEGPQSDGMDDLPAALRDVTDDAPVVLLAHEPDIFGLLGAADRHVALTISGHTHGGQVRIMGGTPLINASDNETWSWGRYDDDAGRSLIVSGGIGCSVLPMRLGVPPELTVIDLVPPDEDASREKREARERYEAMRRAGQLVPEGG
jgi:predicted MPP superfamily phosphohydrolase